MVVLYSVGGDNENFSWRFANSKLPDISRPVLSLCSSCGGASVLQCHLSPLPLSLFCTLGPWEEKDANGCLHQSLVRL